jgi:acetyl-CoA decarbonylase/synthase complex subunit gamma
VIRSIRLVDQKIPVVDSALNINDHIGTFKARWGINRMHYMIDSGLYALGNPNDKSDVFVTANYKLSFDKLRSSLTAMNAWILVLNTNGINVWCAAGKRTFGTAELVNRIRTSRLTELVDHRRLIVPQLGAPGIAAHEIKKQTGFKVIYGPVQAKDIPAFIASGYQATPAMRVKEFPMSERIALIPMELIPALKHMAIILPVMFIISGIFGGESFWENTLANSLFGTVMILGGLTAGTIITPAALPWLPGSAFSVKAATAGVITAFFIAALFLLFASNIVHAGSILSMCLLATGLSSFLGMNFTGGSTYTSLSGVRKEMRIAVPLQITAIITGLLFWISSLLGIT